MRRLMSAMLPEVSTRLRNGLKPLAVMADPRKASRRTEFQADRDGRAKRKNPRAAVPFLQPETWGV